MHQSIDIARITADQPERVGPLLDVFAEGFEDAENYSSARPSPAYLTKLLGTDTFIALLATVNQEPAGALAAYELVKFEQERSEIYIYDLAVLEPYRRLGIATGLINALHPIAKARGAKVIFVQSDYGDDPAIALYTKLGSREDVLHFDIEVE